MDGMAYLHGLERQGGEDEIKSGIKTLLVCTTSGGDRWYTDEELRDFLLAELEDAIYLRDENEAALAAIND